MSYWHDETVMDSQDRRVCPDEIGNHISAITFNGYMGIDCTSFCTPPDLLAHKMLTFQWQMVPDEGV